MKKKWLIYSHEHRAWWMPASNGYTPDIKEAGRYSFDEAREIVTEANRFCYPKAIHESMLPDPHE